MKNFVLNEIQSYRVLVIGEDNFVCIKKDCGIGYEIY